MDRLKWYEYILPISLIELGLIIWIAGLTIYVFAKI